jgi:hypothetical protein
LKTDLCSDTKKPIKLFLGRLVCMYAWKSLFLIIELFPFITSKWNWEPKWMHWSKCHKRSIKWRFNLEQRFTYLRASVHCLLNKLQSIAINLIEANLPLRLNKNLLICSCDSQVFIAYWMIRNLSLVAWPSKWYSLNFGAKRSWNRILPGNDFMFFEGWQDWANFRLMDDCLHWPFFTNYNSFLQITTVFLQITTVFFTNYNSFFNKLKQVFYKLQQVFLQITTAFLTNYNSFFYKLQQFFNKLQQIFFQITTVFLRITTEAQIYGLIFPRYKLQKVQ